MRPGAMPDYITRAELQSMVDACDPTTLAGKRDRLLLVVLRALGGRSREAAVLSVARSEPGLLALFIGDEIVEIPSGEFTDHDPSQLMNAWLTALTAQSEFVIDSDMFFAPVTKDGLVRSPGGLTPWSINQIVKRAAARAGLDNPERYTARIMRGPTRRKVKR